MSGTITFRKGRPHRSVVGALVGPVQIEDRDWERLEKIAERPLDPLKRNEIAEALQFLRHIAVCFAEDRTSAQDVKETLRKIGGLSGEKVQQAVNDCDGQSRTLIDRALYQIGERDDFNVCAPEKFKAAALLALQDFKGCNGRPADGRPYFYRFALSIWASLGRTDDAAWQIEGEPTPLTEFATALLALIEENPPGYSQVAKDITNFRKVSA